MMQHLCLYFIICVLSSLCLAAKDPYSVKIEFSKDFRTCTDQIKNDSNCVTNDTAGIEGCHTEKIVRDHINCCYVCPKKLGEECGGYFSNHGRCEKMAVCRHETIPFEAYSDYAEKIKNLHPGVCIPLVSKSACRKKNCCSRGKDLKCGTDGKWYLNTCFRVKANCFRPHGSPPITKYSGDPIAKCGERPPDCITPNHMCTKQYRLGDKRPILYYTPDEYTCKKKKNNNNNNNDEEVKPTQVTVQPVSSPDILEE